MYRLLRAERAVKFRLAEVETATFADRRDVAFIDQPVDGPSRQTCVESGAISADDQIRVQSIILSK